VGCKHKHRFHAVADSVSPLLKDIGVPHAILINLAKNCTKQQIIFGAETKKVLERDSKIQKLLYALYWLIKICVKLGSYLSFTEACRLSIFICKPQLKSPAKLHADSTHCMQRCSSFATQLREQK
jgi:hypothetical protein